MSNTRSKRLRASSSHAGPDETIRTNEKGNTMHKHNVLAQRNIGATGDLLDKIIAYEDGIMDEFETIQFFQELVDTGMAWQLQGSYGRTATAMLQAGEIHTNN